MKILQRYDCYNYFFQEKNKIIILLKSLLCMLIFACNVNSQTKKVDKPNIIIIYTDDLGFGDISSNGATSIKTTNIDRLAKSGINFNNAHSTSAICTPSRYSLLTGKYAWRQLGTGIAAGNAALIIDPSTETLPSMLQKAGYKTAVVGKWHLGLGTKSELNWNGLITPGPKEIGFDYSFILPATGDRVPCVYVENQKVVNLDLNDSLIVSYNKPISNSDPTGKSNPELLIMQPSHGHDMSIINGVSRIGYMSGGKSASWKDEEIADVLVNKSVEFIKTNTGKPFFLYLATHDIHVPRLPHSRFLGKSGLGPRGDAILQLDFTVGAIMASLKKLKILDKTLIIFTSDNGAVLDDGYKDDAVLKNGNHLPNGIFRGGKYSAFEGGTRVPFIVSWKGKVASNKTSSALLSQIDLYASLSELVGIKLNDKELYDSKNYLGSLLGKSNQSRDFLIEQSLNNTLSIIMGEWKYIESSEGATVSKNTNIELGNLKAPQLYNLAMDPGEKNNLAKTNQELVEQLSKKLNNIRNQNKN